MAGLFKKRRSGRSEPNLESVAIWFTVVLYVLICIGLLAFHYSQPQHPVGETPGMAILQER